MQARGEARTGEFSVLVLTIVKRRVIVGGFGVLGDCFSIKQNQVCTRNTKKRFGQKTKLLAVWTRVVC
ncbi:hypothetical protein V6Z11_D04G093400 [Gossypium hirsutum]